MNLLYLKRCICIHLKLGHHLGPGFKLLALRVDVVIKHGAIGGELDGFELTHPPLAELHPVVDQLQSHRAHTQRHRGRAGGQYSKMTSSLHPVPSPYSSYGSVRLIYAGVNTNWRRDKWRQHRDAATAAEG